jgi:MFS family permease
MEMTSEIYNAQIKKYYRRNFIAASLDNMMFFFIFLGLSPYTVLPYYLENLTQSKFLIGLIPAIFILGIAIPQPFMAKFLRGKRQRLRYLIAAAAVQRSGILAFFLLTLVQNRLPNSVTIVLFFVFFTLQNLASGFWLPAWVDFIGRAIPHNRGMLFGWSNFIGGLLSLAGGALMTYLLKILPYPQAISALAGIALVASLISLGAIASWKEILPLEEVFQKDRVKEGQVKQVFRDRNFVNFLGWRGLMIGLEIATPFFALYAIHELQLSPSYLGIFTLLMSISQTVINPLWGWYGDHKGYLNVILVSALLGVIATILAATTQQVFWFYVVFLFTGIMLSGEQINSISGINIIFEFSSPAMVPTYLSLSQIILSPLSGIAPALGGILVERAGYLPTFWIAALLGMAGTMGVALKVKNPKRLQKAGEMDILVKPADG